MKSLKIANELLKLAKSLTAGLSRSELDTLVGLLDVIENAGSFGSRDMRLRVKLENKATDAQLIKAYKKAKLDVNDYLDL